MKRKTFITVFVVTHILFITLYIDKQSKIVKLSYKQQRLETEKGRLLKRKQELTNTLYAFKNPAEVKEFATQSLNMEPLTLTQVKRINHS